MLSNIRILTGIQSFKLFRLLTKKDTKLIFSDNGLGMDLERVKDRIFGLYQRLHNIANSKGIGLYLVHSQITSLGGKIEVASAVNIGTTLTITF